MMAGSVPTLDDFPEWFLWLVATPLGLIWGSFLNVVIHRLPRGQNVAWPASRCPACAAPIRAWENVPLLGYLFLRGRARCCGARISPRYPLVEATGLLLALAVLRLIVLELPGDTSILRALGFFALYFGLGLALVALTFIDLEFMLLPDSLTLGGGLIGLTSAGFRGEGFANAAIGAALGFAIVFLPFDLAHRWLRGYPGMGLGDAKLTALAGAWFGWQGALFTLFGGAVQATVVTLCVYLARGRVDEPEAVIRERAEHEAKIAAAEGEERLQLERERELDPVLKEPESGLGKIRIPFGPFLALATLEFALLVKPLFAFELEQLFSPFS
jgi:leader peptidase (prepilin peptidase)/N-methyltransferase